MEQYTRCKDVT